MRTLEETIASLSAGLLALDPGPLAGLRRMEPGDAGAAAYWRLASEYGFLDAPADIWMRIVNVMAILTPKGERQPPDRLHDAKQGLGTVLCDGGDSAWPGDIKGAEPRPFLSETRLARFLAQPVAQRGQALERLARMLAPSRSPESGVNCTHIAWLLLNSNGDRTTQTIARDYYRRLDTASRSAQSKENKA
jgi:CRISPR system Cascade subunit CasB